MTNVTHIYGGRLSQALRELLKKVEMGEITYIEGLAQVETDGFVEWHMIQEGEKSFDHVHLVNQIGYHDLIKQSIIEDICETLNED